MQSKDNLLRLERNKVEELMRKGESLEKDLREKESELTITRDVGNSGQGASEIVEAESVVSSISHELQFVVLRHHVNLIDLFIIAVQDYLIILY